MGYKQLELNGKTAVIVGGTSGIGRAIALGLAEAGADVIPTARRSAEVDSTAGEVESLGRRSLRITSDVTDRASLERLLHETVEIFGKVDILVNSAGRTKRTRTLDLDEKEWNDILETNLTGIMRTCQIFGRHMVSRGYGRIVNVASIGSFIAMLEVAAYSASKAAVLSLTQSLALEWAGRGVCVNAIVPGVFQTGLNRDMLIGAVRGQEWLMRTPMKRFGEVQELVGAAIYLASDAASFTTGSALVVDGGILASGVNQ
jgi:NAD(P)-dependent dehydrogenase (short-subunit alcohol dehydrogenase family)